MGIDPELQDRLENLRNGYGDTTPVSTAKAEKAVSRREADWEIRTGYKSVQRDA